LTIATPSISSKVLHDPMDSTDVTGIKSRIATIIALLSTSSPHVTVQMTIIDIHKRSLLLLLLLYSYQMISRLSKLQKNTLKDWDGKLMRIETRFMSLAAYAKRYLPRALEKDAENVQNTLKDFGKEIRGLLGRRWPRERVRER
jgi:hypothetical protein